MSRRRELAIAAGVVLAACLVFGWIRWVLPTRHAVDIKVLIEQLREQIQNIE